MSDHAVKLSEWRGGDRVAACSDGSTTDGARLRSPGLLPCPFCGSAPVRDVHPRSADIIRFACRAERCAIQPATEYLLEEYAESLRNTWNWRWTPAARTA